MSARGQVALQKEARETLREMLLMERVFDANEKIRRAEDVIYGFITAHGQHYRVPHLFAVRDMLRAKYGNELMPQQDEGGAAAAGKGQSEFRRSFDDVFDEQRLRATNSTDRTVQLVLFFSAIVLEPRVREYFFPHPTDGAEDRVDRAEWLVWFEEHLKPAFFDFLAGAIDAGVFARNCALMYCALKAADPLHMPGRTAQQRTQAQRRVASSPFSGQGGTRGRKVNERTTT